MARVRTRSLAYITRTVKDTWLRWGVGGREKKGGERETEEKGNAWQGETERDREKGPRT